jgi:serine/threonine-protein kinase
VTADRNSVDWEVVEAGLDALLALPPGERPAALDRIAASNAAVRRELESLLQFVDGEDAVLDRPPGAPGGSSGAAGSIAPGTRIGAYRVLRLVGRGGMGEVYLAERADGQYQQQVALKLIRREIADQSARFQLERQTLARLDHPGIARLLDGGVTEDGRPYMVMELVMGRDLISWCRERHCSLEERLRLFIDVCTALEYAHRNLVVHRDLKPANVVVTKDGVVKLLDFGIAKLLAPPGGDTPPEHAPTENAPLTLSYAAPEQISHGAITTATDVYALGMLLFELLTGARPWNFNELSLAAGIDKVLREMPPAMSDFAQARGDSPVPPRLLQGDLDVIAAKALRKEPERRYESVSTLRGDLERSRRHEPVAAREGAKLYAVGRFLRRYRMLVATLGVAVLALLGGTAATLWQANAARLEARRADAVRDFLLDIFQHNSVNNPDGAHARQTTAEQLLDIGAERIRTGLTSEPQVRGKVMDVLADLYDQLEKFDKVAELEHARLAEIERAGNHPSSEKAAAQSLLGRALLMQGDYGAAYDELNAALATMNEIHENSVQRAEILLETGRIAYHRATPESLRAALQYAQQSLAAYEKTEPANPDRLFALQLAARVAERQGRPPEAERLYRDFLKQAELAQFDGIPALRAHGHDDLGSLLLDERRYREAEPELRQAMETFAKAEGEKQLDTATDQAYLGELLIATNRGREGDALMHEALAALEETQGVDNLPTTAVVRLRYARAEFARGNVPSAAALLAKNVAAFEAKNPHDQNYWPETLRSDAEVKLAEGNYREAEAELKRSDALWPADGPNDGAKHGINRVLEARVALNAGTFDDATRAILEQVRTTWPAAEQRLPAVYVLATLALAEAAHRQNRDAEAADLTQGLLDRIQREPEHESLADWEARARLLLGGALMGRGHADVAGKQLVRAVELRERFDDPASPWLAEARRTLAACRCAPPGK